MPADAAPAPGAGTDFAPRPGAGGLPRLLLTAVDGARAELYLHGAQVTSWIPAHEGSDRLFLSASAQFRVRGPI